jgi:hypothetical protein
MARLKGSGLFGPVRSARLPRGLEAWFLQRLQQDPAGSTSELLVRLIHDGLRLRGSYIKLHRQRLIECLKINDVSRYENYTACLVDTFGTEYLHQLESGLGTDGIEIQKKKAR